MLPPQQPLRGLLGGAPPGGLISTSTSHTRTQPTAVEIDEAPGLHPFRSRKLGGACASPSGKRRTHDHTELIRIPISQSMGENIGTLSPGRGCQSVAQCANVLDTQ